MNAGAPADSRSPAPWHACAVSRGPAVELGDRSGAALSATAAGDAHFEQLAPRRPSRRDFLIVRRKSASAGRLDLVGAVPLGLQPRLAGHKLVERLDTMARLARVWFRRAGRDSPALTRSHRAPSSPTTPPVGCCTFLTLELTTTGPGDDRARDLLGDGPAPDRRRNKQLRRRRRQGACGSNASVACDGA